LVRSLYKLKWCDWTRFFSAIDTTTPPPREGGAPKNGIAWGFYPSGTVTLNDPTKPGTLKDDTNNTATAARAYPITKEQYLLVVAEINTLKNAPGTYHLADNNCTTTVVGIMKKLDLTLIGVDIQQSAIQTADNNDAKPYYRPHELEAYTTQAATQDSIFYK